MTIKEEKRWQLREKKWKLREKKLRIEAIQEGNRAGKIKIKYLYKISESESESGRIDNKMLLC